MKPHQTTQELEAARTKYRGQVLPQRVLDIMDSETARLNQSGLADRALKVGEMAPDFILPDARGRPVRLHSLLESGPVVLVFYRGGWCPYCNLHLRGFQRSLPAIEKLGARLVAISPQLPDESLSTQEKNELTYPVLSDVGNRVAATFGVAFRLGEELVGLYRELGHPLDTFNGPQSGDTLPMPATFLIDTDGKIVRAHVEVDYTRRLDPDFIVSDLETLAARKPLPPTNSGDATPCPAKPAMTRKGLFDPLQLGAIHLPNRILMAPLTRMRASMPGNIPWELNAEYYRQRASAGLIISEATPVSPRGHGYFHTPGIHTEAQAEGWKKVTQAVHEAEGRIFLQLWHVGRQSHRELQPDGEAPVAPSALASNGQSPVRPGVIRDHSLPRALTTEEVSEVVGEFRHGAELARMAGFDGVEIHGANGYLIEQFLADGSNHRTDRYGGDVANRVRFLIEITEAVVSIWGGNRVGIRLSPANTFGGITNSDRFGTYQHAIRELNRFGLAYLHLVEPRIGGNVDLNHFDETLNSVHFKPLITGDTRLVAAGGFDFVSGQELVASGGADAIAYGRWFISNPDLPRRFATGAALQPYHRESFYGGDAVGYTDYPFLNGIQPPV